MSRIAYVTNAPLPTAKAHGFAIAKMCEAMADIGHEVELWFPQAAWARGSERDLFAFYGIRPGFVPRPLPTWPIAHWRKWLPSALFRSLMFVRGWARAAYALIRSRRLWADLYWSRDAVIVFVFTLFRRSTIYEVHSVPLGLRRRLVQRAVRRSSMAGVITLTHALKDSLVSLGAAPDKVVAFPNAVDPSMFDSVPTRPECRALLGLPPAVPLMGYVGRFKTSRGLDKGIPQLIEAMAFLPSEVQLLCVGGPLTAVPEFQAKAIEVAVDPERLRFIDHVPPTEIPIWIRSCDVLVIPWWSRPDADSPAPPLKLFEYLAAGAAIVTTDMSEITDFISDGENGLVVGRSDVEALAGAVLRILRDDNLRSALELSASRSATSFSWRRRVEAALAVAAPELS